MQKKVILFATQRTGSSYIARCLNNHPNVRMHGEILNISSKNNKDGIFYYLKERNKIINKLFLNKYYSKINKVSNINNFLLNYYVTNYFHEFYKNDNRFFTRHNMINDSLNDEVYYDRLNADEQVVGFKLMYTHLYIFNRALNYHETENCYIIYLFRKNILKQYVSGVIKNKRKISHSDIKPENVTINLDTNGLVKELDKNIKYNELMKKCFKNNPRLEISYESFFSDPQKNLINIFDFISIKPCDVKLPKMVKLTDDNLSNIIENYNEVYVTLCNTKYSDYLK